MQKDTRDKNEYPLEPTIGKFVLRYASQIQSALAWVDHHQLNLAATILQDVRTLGGQVFSAGNGGSAAIANHLECDFSKGCQVDKTTLKSRSLSANPSMLTALGNDIGFEDVYSSQIEMYGAEDDALILISSSGNSPNIKKALDTAKEKKMRVIGFSGFHGGYLKEHSDASLHIPIHNYGVVEDAHQALMHCLAQWQYLKTRAE